MNDLASTTIDAAKQDEVEERYRELRIERHRWELVHERCTTTFVRTQYGDPILVCEGDHDAFAIPEPPVPDEMTEAEYVAYVNAEVYGSPDDAEVTA